jgi:poly-gamma-glutamate capsule biosynthesis protein CapA/YwtB (metallophosphatase superfamily)
MKKINQLVVYISVLGVMGCGPSPSGVSQESFLTTDQEQGQAFFSTPITLSGQVVNEAGDLIVGARLRLEDEADAQQYEALSGTEGTFQFSGLSRHHALLYIDAEGYQSEILVVDLKQEATLTETNLSPVVLTPSEDNTRMVFGGDVAFGRRFLDPDENTSVNAVPDDNADALIQASDPELGTRAAVKWIKPHYASADFSVVNFETPITDNPITPHPEKDFVFFTLPDSIKGLQWLGVDYVSMGNNHVYDYLEQGLEDTTHNLDQYGLAYSGAGVDSASAFSPYRAVLPDGTYSMISATSVSGDQHSVNYVAGADKGGAADIREQDLFRNTVEQEAQAGYFPIVQLHMGTEYTFQPTDYAQGQLNDAVEYGASLVVSHHPHVAQGVGQYQGVYQLQGLGNLAFDQARLETMLSQIARVDFRNGQVQQIRILPVYLKDFQPRLIGGKLADYFLRRIAEFSQGHGAYLAPYLGQGWVFDEKPEHLHQTRQISHKVTLPETGVALVDLRTLSDSDESISHVAFNTGIQVQLGRDLLLFGDMEDWDTDSDVLEASRWDLSSDSTRVCVSQVYDGRSALCSVRGWDSSSDSVISLRNRVGVMGNALDQPNKNLSFYGQIKGIDAGKVQLISRYYASAGELEFGEETVAQYTAGSYDWQTIFTDLNMPEDSTLPEEGGAETE